jgi:two-component system sensor histidine kinase KdpD
MVFLLGVLFTSVLTSSRIFSMGIAICSVFVFNFLFTEPRFSFFIYNPTDFMLLLFFLITAAVSGTITSRLQNEKINSGRNEKTARMLYEIASGFLSVSGKKNVAEKGEALIQEHVGLKCRVLLSDRPGSSVSAAALNDSADSDNVFEIRSSSDRIGTLVTSEKKLNDMQKLVIRATCVQLGIALEREELVYERESIRLAMEREQQRTILLRSVAHDLRSPLTALSGASTLLTDGYDSLDDKERKKLSSDMSEEIIWLTDLVENILNMTRISEKKLVLNKQEEVIDDIVGEAVAHTKRLLSSRSFTVNLPAEVVTAPMDGRLIIQVIINLLENAVRHTPDNASISLSAWADADKVYVSVKDTGDGIPESIRGRLFERFVTQDDKIVDGRRGLGLGLAICKTIVRAHGGEITAEDNIPKGSSFTFYIPREEKTE